MALHKSGEDYLETILIMEERYGEVRSVDVAAELKYSKPSVSRAVSILKGMGYVEMDKSRKIHLTEKGREKATEIYRRHKLLTRYFAEVLGVDYKTAEEDACRIEHVISDESLEKIIVHMDAAGKNRAAAKAAPSKGRKSRQE
ncbi:MAG: metal-dependent transcriptional regulator [Peptococcaceae bacterium]|nr:metal-dependent transcriptional regulator [Peptococcaceae bacterium]